METWVQVRVEEIFGSAARSQHTIRNQKYWDPVNS